MTAKDAIAKILDREQCIAPGDEDMLIDELARMGFEIRLKCHQGKTSSVPHNFEIVDQRGRRLP